MFIFYSLILFRCLKCSLSFCWLFLNHTLVQYLSFFHFTIIQILYFVILDFLRCYVDSSNFLRFFSEICLSEIKPLAGGFSHLKSVHWNFLCVMGRLVLGGLMCCFSPLASGYSPIIKKSLIPYETMYLHDVINHWPHHLYHWSCFM
jgi:hypothetical protein